MIFSAFRYSECDESHNPATDFEIPISNKATRPKTSLREVLIGLFMFLLGIVSLTFLAFYMYSRILNGGLKHYEVEKLHHQNISL